MTRDEVRSRVAAELGDILDHDDLRLTDDTVAKDIHGWDSLNHLKLLVALEKSFRIKFKLSELNDAENVGGLVDTILARTAE